jgi:hypothetical protein
MLHLLDESLEAFLRAAVPLAQRDVDVVFEAPDGDWAAGLSARPTVNLYLWDVRPNLSEREFGEELISREDGRRFRRDPLPRVDCRYLVTAWTTEVGNEHKVLGDVLAVLLLHPVIPAEYLRGPFATVRPLPGIRLRSGDGTDNSDFWSALGGQLKPGLDLVVTATVDATMSVLAGPPVEKVQPSIIGINDQHPAATVAESPAGEAPDGSPAGAAGGQVRSRAPRRRAS